MTMIHERPKLLKTEVLRSIDGCGLPDTGACPRHLQAAAKAMLIKPNRCPSIRKPSRVISEKVLVSHYENNYVRW